MNTLSTQTGVATDTLQELKYMEDLVDVSLEQVTGSMAKNIKSMSKAKTGSATYVKAYERLAVSVTDANGNLRDSEDVYWDVIDALGNVANETERNSLAMTIFGKSAQTLNPLIAQGSAGINELKKEAQSVGAVLSQDTLDAMNAVNDQFDRLSAQSDALKREIGVELAPSILSAATEIGTAIQENKEDLINLASGGIDVVTTGMTWIIEHAQGVVAGVTAIGGAMLTLKAGSRFRRERVIVMLKNCVFKVSVSTKNGESCRNRAIKTMAQTAVSIIAVGSTVTTVDWKLAVSSAVVAGVVSLLTSVAGIPEVEDERK